MDFSFLINSQRGFKKNDEVFKFTFFQTNFAKRNGAF